jgi:hypothetical protein
MSSGVHCATAARCYRVTRLFVVGRPGQVPRSLFTRIKRDPERLRRRSAQASLSTTDSRAPKPWRSRCSAAKRGWHRGGRVVARLGAARRPFRFPHRARASPDIRPAWASSSRSPRRATTHAPHVARSRQSRSNRGVGPPPPREGVGPQPDQPTGGQICTQHRLATLAGCRRGTGARPTRRVAATSGGIASSVAAASPIAGQLTAGC